MIVFDLRCDAGHRFEGWFSSADDFSGQKAKGLLSCPACGESRVERVPSATRFTAVNVEPPKAPAASSQDKEGRDPMALAQILYSRMLDELLAKSEDVGERFPVEARRIHNDQAPKRSIRGVATQEEHDALVEEGVPVARLPIPPSSRWN